MHSPGDTGRQVLSMLWTSGSHPEPIPVLSRSLFRSSPGAYSGPLPEVTGDGPVPAIGLHGRLSGHARLPSCGCRGAYEKGLRRAYVTSQVGLKMYTLLGDQTNVCSLCRYLLPRKPHVISRYKVSRFSRPRSRPVPESESEMAEHPY